MGARALVGAALAVLLVAAGARAETRLVDDALSRFEQGDYEQVVATLKDTVDSGGTTIADLGDRALALRVYGIACVLTSRRLAAESAFLHWLELEPRAHLDPTLVRPEVVGFFEEVRQRHRSELLREVEKRRPRNPLLNLLPPAGQFQNGQRGKFGVVAALEVVTGGLSLASGLTLYASPHPNGNFETSLGNTTATQLQVVDYIATAAFISLVVYGIVDGFAVYARHRREHRLDEESLRASAPPRLRPTGDGLALSF